MAHELENMFSVSETPWHGLGKVIVDAPSIESVLELAGLDWSVSLQGLFTQAGKRAEMQAITRDSDQSILGYATGQRWVPFQNNEALNFFKPFHESGAAKFETAGSLRQGQKIWILAALQNAELEIVKGDVIRKYLLLSNAHDGKTSIRIGFTPIRVVCANTLAMAHRNDASSLLRVNHSRNTQATMESIQAVVNTANAAFEATAEQYKRLARKSVVQADVERYVRQVFYNGIQAESDRAKLAQEKLTERITELFQTGRGTDVQGVQGTAWGLYNAATEYLSYDKGRDQDVRLDNLWFGSGINLNQTALKVAIEL